MMVALVTLAGCAGKPKPLVSSPEVIALDAKELPNPVLLNDPGTKPYAIGPLDKLQIYVVGIEELSLVDVQVDPMGRISMPLAGVIVVGGLQLPEVEQEIVLRLRLAHVRNPVVSVNYKEVVSQTFSIDGEVKRPGLYPAPVKLTLMQAVARGEGISDVANLEDVVVFRTVKDQRYAALFNLKAIRRGAYGDPAIFPGDIIIVGDSKARRLFLQILQVVPLLTPVIVLIK